MIFFDIEVVQCTVELLSFVEWRSTENEKRIREVESEFIVYV